MVPAGNKSKRLSSVNHSTKTIHHYHRHHLNSVPCGDCPALHGENPTFDKEKNR